MPDIKYGSVEMGAYEATSRVGLVGQFTVDIPRPLRFMVEEPLVAGYYPGQDYHGFYIMHDPKASVRWGLTVYPGNRIKAVFPRESVRDLQQSRASNVSFELGRPRHTRASLNRLDFQVAPEGTGRISRAEVKKELHWPTKVLVENTQGKPHPMAVAGEPKPQLVPVADPLSLLSDFLVSLVVTAPSGEKFSQADSVRAISEDEAVGILFRQVREERAGCSVQLRSVRRIVG